MADRVFYQRVTTNKSPEEVRNAGIAAMRYVGGGIRLTHNGFMVLEGKLGTTMGAFASVSATVVIQKIGETVYEYQIMLHWEPSGWTWFFLVLGIVGGISTIILGVSLLLPLLYFLFNPTIVYQNAVGRIPYLLEPEKDMYR